MDGIFVVGVVSVVGCSNAEQSAPPPPKVPSVPFDASSPIDARPHANQPALTVTLDGTAVPIASAIATIEGDEIRVEMANYPYTCKEKLARFSDRGSQPTDIEITIRIRPYLHTDGRLGLATAGTYVVVHTDKRSTTAQTEAQDGGDPLPIDRLDPVAGTTVDVPLDHTLTSIEAPQRTLIVKGTAKVTGCGRAGTPDPQPTPQPGSPAPTLSLSGRAFPIGGAAYSTRKDGGRTLLLSTHPAACVEGTDYAASRGDVVVTLEWTKAGQLYFVGAGGRWLKHAQSQADGMKVSATANRASGGTTIVQLGGGELALGGYTLKLAGKVNAVLCPQSSRR